MRSFCTYMSASTGPHGPPCKIRHFQMSNNVGFLRYPRIDPLRRGEGARDGTGGHVFQFDLSPISNFTPRAGVSEFCVRKGHLPA